MCFHHHTVTTQTIAFPLYFTSTQVFKGSKIFSKISQLPIGQNQYCIVHVHTIHKETTHTHLFCICENFSLIDTSKLGINFKVFFIKRLLIQEDPMEKNTLLSCKSTSPIKGKSQDLVSWLSTLPKLSDINLEGRLLYICTLDIIVWVITATNTEWQTYLKKRQFFVIVWVR